MCCSSWEPSLLLLLLLQLLSLLLLLDDELLDELKEEASEPGPLPPAFNSRCSCFLISFLATSTFNARRERFFFCSWLPLVRCFSFGFFCPCSWLSDDEDDEELELELLLLLLLSPDPLELLELFDGSPFCFFRPSTLSELELELDELDELVELELDEELDELDELQ